MVSLRSIEPEEKSTTAGQPQRKRNLMVSLSNHQSLPRARPGVSEWRHSSTTKSLKPHSRPGNGHHQHGAVLPHHFIIEINRNNRIGPHALGFIAEFFIGLPACIA